MIRKYRVDFRCASGVLIHPYDKEGVMVEAHSAEDAVIQARIEIDVIVKKQSDIIGRGSDTWWFTKIVPISNGSEQAIIEAEREACIQILNELIPVSRENQDLLNLAKEKIRARSES